MRLTTSLLLLIVLINCGPKPAEQTAGRPPLPITSVPAGETVELHLPDYLPPPLEVEVMAATGVEAVLSGEQLQLQLPVDGSGLGLVILLWEADTLLLPLRISARFPVEIIYPVSDPELAVTVFGSFNSWNRQSHPLAFDPVSGWSRTLFLEPGSYPYRLQVAGEDRLDPACAQKVPNGFGDFNSLLEITSVPAPELWFVSSGQTGSEVVYTYSLDNSEAELLVLWDNHRLPATLLEREGQTVQVRLPLESGFTAGSHLLRLVAAGGGRAGNVQQLQLRDGLPESGFLPQDMLIYSLVVDRFSDGDPGNNRAVGGEQLSPKADYQGGDLAGVLQKTRAGYFNELGVTTLWISPLYQGPLVARQEFPEPHRWFSDYHGYWPINPRGVDPRFGTLRQLRELTDLLHERQQSVLMDFVSHHVYEDHPYFREHPDWFGQLELPDGSLNLRRWDDYRLTTWFEPFLPSFDLTCDNGAAEALAADAGWWLREGGLDGFRQDAVKHIPLRFWRILATTLDDHQDFRGGRPFQIGETFGSYDLVGSYVKPRLLDSQFNFNLFYTARRTFLDSEADFNDLDRELRKGLQSYGWHHLMGNLVDSHDQVRFMAYADGDINYADEGNTAEIGWSDPPEVDDPQSYDRMTQFLAFVMTIPGIPTLYYGDEIGMTGAADPDNRRPMRFELTVNEEKMLSRTRTLGQLRRDHPALRRGDFHTLLADSGVYAILRSYPADQLLVVHNKRGIALQRTLQLPVHLADSTPELLFGELAFVQNGTHLELELPPFASVVVGFE
ncbi:MAG: alpha-glucosidase C-terminal domain-containing protein [Candidatus Delongbacteria bacterium]|nr:alpha-glucosidase C-terminal domain-containing protein [Candidatus Delongbacteria bacterium]